MSNILVIKHGALGNIVLATAAFAGIREYHKNDHITLLTTQRYAGMLRASGYFDDIWIDNRPKLYHFKQFFGLMNKIKNSKFSRIYDLQTSERTSWYFKLLGKPAPEWSGIAKNASHRYHNTERKKLHTLDRIAQQLKIAGFEALPAPDIRWLKAGIGHFNLPERYAIVVPGGSEHRLGKRWSAHNYGNICNWLLEKGIIPVLIGTKAEAAVISTIETISPHCINLLGKTSFFEIAELARNAVFAVGNDTGPMHIIAATGSPALVLFSQFSNPALCAPRGQNVTVLQEANLSHLSPEKIKTWIQPYISR